MESLRVRSALLLRTACLAALLFVNACASHGQSDKLGLVALLKTGQFTTLESELVRYQQRFEADSEAEWPAYDAFFAFATSDPTLETRLSAWIAAMPRSYAAAMARGMYYEHLGWMRRGTAFAGQTPKQRFADMHRYFELANTDLQHAIAINNRLVPAYVSMVRMARGEGTHEEMQQILKAGLTVAPESLQLHLAFLDGLNPIWGGSMAETRAYLKAIERDHPKFASLKWFAGYADYAEGRALFRGEGRFEDTLAHLDRALGFDDHDAEYRSERAEVLFMLDREPEAEATLEPALAAEPQNTTYLMQMAKIQWYQHRPEEALATINKALAIDPYDPDYLRLRAQLLAGAMRYAEAVRTLDDALVYGGDDPRMLTERSNDLMYVGRLPDAIETARHATELAPDYSRAWLQYADMLFIGRDCKAKQALRIFRTVCKFDGLCGEEAKSGQVSGIVLMPCGKA